MHQKFMEEKNKKWELLPLIGTFSLYYFQPLFLSDELDEFYEEPHIPEIPLPATLRFPDGMGLLTGITDTFVIKNIEVPSIDSCRNGYFKFSILAARDGSLGEPKID
ncbi:MAG: hypothetical protein PHH44_08910 [bacterium]|nr:hypothetical protein [bacterium]